MISQCKVFLEIVDQEAVASSQGAVSTIQELNGSGETCYTYNFFYLKTSWSLFGIDWDSQLSKDIAVEQVDV